MNYFDILLAKKLEDDRDPKVEGLSVNKNGTYSEEGVVYKPVVVALPLDSKTITANGVYKASDDNLEGFDEVIVNVPLPANAYLKKSVSGLPQPIASFTDGAEAPLNALTVDIEAIQSGSGDPSPSNVRPISGWSGANVSVCGVNIWDEEWELGYWSRGSYVTGPSVCSKSKIPINPNTTYYIQVPQGTNFYYSFYDKNGDFLNLDGLDSQGRYYRANSGTIITHEKAYYITWNVGSSYGTTYNNDISINYPSTDTDYHAYNGNTYSLTFTDGSNPLTVYGGTVDLISGVMTVTHGYADMGTLTWSYQSTPKVFNTNISGLKRGLLICSNYKYTDVNYVEQIKDGEIWDKNNAFGLTNVVVKDLRYTSASDFETAMNGVQLVYELATPTTIALSPTAIKSLLNNNNIFADCGDVESLEYFSREV